MKWKARPKQIEKAKLAVPILREHMIVYLAMEERTGKTITSLLVCEEVNVKNVAIITKKKAVKGWLETLENFEHSKYYYVTNYHQAQKLPLNFFDLVILDESHNYISSYPKKPSPSSIWAKVAGVCRGKPIIYISATPCAQGAQQLYHQFALSAWSPWRGFKNFYQWFREYGFPYQIRIQGMPRTQYNKADTERIWDDVDHLFVRGTRAEMGLDKEPEDVVHWIELTKETKDLYNTLVVHEIAELFGEDLVCDTSSKLRTSLHQIEGGAIKIHDEYYVLENTEKIDYIKEHFGDTKDVAIMYNYIAEGTKLRESFEYATILQGTSNAEGVDLSMYEHLIIYSQDFSTARHNQRRARQANAKRRTDIKVHYLLVNKAISADVYRTVSINKRNYVDAFFTRGKI